MSRNTHVKADVDAPPVTRILAKFVATHPSRGWSDAVDHEAHRTFMNWVGCAVGAARHAAADACVAAVKMLEPAPQSSILGRAEKVDMASAALVNGITSHTFDFDDTHLKTIIHPAGPVASALLALLKTEAFGTYHMANSGATTWFEFAREALRRAELAVEVEPTSYKSWPSKVRRPAYSALNVGKLRSLGLVMPTWQEGVAAYVSALT